MFSRPRKSLSVLLVVLLPLSAWAVNDPTRPSAYQAAHKAQALKLESILYSDTRKVAVINGSVLSEGERIGRRTVIKIEKQRVRLRGAGKDIVLTLKRTPIRQEQ